MAGWFYMRKGMFSDDQIGPVDDTALLQLAYDGQVNPKTLVSHPSKTAGQWVHLERLGAAMKKYEEGVRGRHEEREKQRIAKENERRRRELERQEQQAIQAEVQRQAAIQQAAAQAESTSQLGRFLGDGQDPNVIAKIIAKAEQLLTSSESIEYVAVQAKPLMVSPDAVLLTNRRLVVVRQKILGQMSFVDYLWLDLRNAHVQEGMIFSEISFQTVRGEVVRLDYLPKVQARRIYRVAQEREEAAIEQRRRRWIEEQRASANNIVVNAAIPSQPISVPASTQSQINAANNDDPVSRLNKLKQMLEAGLIEKEEYDATKRRILESF